MIIDDKGEIIKTYSKTHLFNVNIPERNINLKESSYVEPGNKILPPVSTVAGMLGLGIVSFLLF